ncbi:recombinase family protein [Microtetraspora glauca]|uniref:Recombinase family protein n=1 Tax=Microtetraspora glauca TaxID=1996 RepID=A0ABV3G8G4_MICGL
MMDALRPGDVVVFTKPDRLGRSVKTLKEIADRILWAGAGLRALDQNIATTTAEVTPAWIAPFMAVAPDRGEGSGRIDG